MMWSLLSRRHQLTAIVLVTLLMAWAIDALYTFALGDRPNIVKTTSLIVAILGTALVAVFNSSWQWLWKRFPTLQRRMFPDLNGKWNGILISTWIDPETGQTKPPIPTVITIRQGLLGTSVSLKTGESTSHSTRALLERFPEASRFRIWYSYNNDPQAQYQHRSSPHEGVAFLELDADTGMDRLRGRYYTARKTTGDIDVTRGSEQE